MIVELTDANFEAEVINSDVPVLVDFWAPWCGPCRAVAPTMEELAESYGEKAKIAKLNVDENQGVAGALRIMSIPTVMVFKGNTVVDMKVGALPRNEYEGMIDGALKAEIPAENA